MSNHGNPSAIDLKPNGIITIYIANDDEIHDDKFLNGIDVVGGMPKNVGLQISGENANGGEHAQRLSLIHI